jgi:hypothetical protein
MHFLCPKKTLPLKITNHMHKRTPHWLPISVMTNWLFCKICLLMLLINLGHVGGTCYFVDTLILHNIVKFVPQCYVLTAVPLKCVNCFLSCTSADVISLEKLLRSMSTLKLIQLVVMLYLSHY